MNEMPPTPEDLLIAFMGTVGFPTLLISIVAALLWLRSWYDVIHGVGSSLESGLTAARGAPSAFLRLVVLQASFVGLTVVLSQLAFLGWTLDAESLGADWQTSSRALLFRAFSGSPLDGVGGAALISAVTYVLFADLSAAAWDGTSVLGCLLGSGIVVSAALAFLAAVVRIDQVAHGGMQSIGSWVTWSVTLFLVWAWSRLLALAGDAPLDLRLAVATIAQRDNRGQSERRANSGGL